MVKGITRRVILVKSPDPHVFEEAIFIVREDVQKSGVTPAEIIREAQDVASNYIKTNVKKGILYRLPPAVYTFIGAAIAGLIWCATELLI
jgi:hypothetical protein